MPQTLTIRDEIPGAPERHEFSLEVVSERLTVRELIRSRVLTEVRNHSARPPQQLEQVFEGLVRPTDAEQTLPGHRLDVEEQVQLAIQAFEGSRVLVLVDDRQVESLDEYIVLRKDSVATFIKLTPLVGG